LSGLITSVVLFSSVFSLSPALFSGAEPSSFAYPSLDGSTNRLSISSGDKMLVSFNPISIIILLNYYIKACAKLGNFPDLHNAICKIIINVV